MSRHEAEQLEMPLGDSQEMNPMDFLLKEDPILDLIKRAVDDLEALNAEANDDSIKILIEVEHPKLQANRIIETVKLEKLVKSLKFSFMRSLGDSMLKAKGEK